MQPFKHSFMMSVQNKIWGIYVRMSQEKKFLEKNLAIKTLEKWLPAKKKNRFLT